MSSSNSVKHCIKTRCLLLTEPQPSLFTPRTVLDLHIAGTMALHSLYGLLPRNFFDIQKGHTLKEEMECYSLPYGGLGFASHILTYYTVIILSTGRSPIRPWKKLCNSRIDLWLSTIGLTGGFAVAVFTLVRCRNHWQLLVIGIWKLSMSFFNGAVGVHVAFLMRKVPKPTKKRGNIDTATTAYRPLVDEEKGSVSSGASEVGSFIGSQSETITKEAEEKVKRPETGWVWLWVLLYLPGMIAGFVGLVSLMIRNWGAHPKLHLIVYAFSGVMGFFVLISFFLFKSDVWAAPILWFMVFASLAALFGDWALGAMADNLLGTPSGDSTGLYWSYFVLKRLTMFSS